MNHCSEAQTDLRQTDLERFPRLVQSRCMPNIFVTYCYSGRGLDGREAVIDFRMDSPEGAPKDARVTRDRVKSELKAAGFELVQEHTFLPNQFFIVFRRVRD
jgi:hypothetical protein